MALLIASPIIYAEEILETYTTRIGTKDHFNSKVEKLNSVAAIIRQDRANFHHFDLKDSEDEADIFFVSKVNRNLLEKMLTNGFTSKKTKEAIMNGTPIIIVTIYKGHINVDLK